ncbi:hypothetical protein SAMN04487969_11976 [Paenibacillus algorifonticola]|uniref:Uncharacterized protein n=1 Tax=Paenibacillus algorifonticola TaxID=684063 RepID=A0A1I2H2X8_9BACL|nr:hypothetical protein [Paenibacillus algorifonticola]SFF23156.1 hypothetical protein SAMN04487969_11976 [Paenibacillus algorifonticola]
MSVKKVTRGKGAKIFAIVMVAFVALFAIIVFSVFEPGQFKKDTAAAQTPKTAQQIYEESGLPKDMVVDDNYKSKYAFKIIKYTPSSRHYSVQQLKGKVTIESADEIVKELYSKEAFSENSGLLGNVVIYDNTAKLTVGQSPGMDDKEQAEYSKREKLIYFGDKTYPFEIAFKKP